jgi:hypothetical protein
MLLFRDPERSVLLRLSTRSAEGRHYQTARAECRSVLDTVLDSGIVGRMRPP